MQESTHMMLSMQQQTFAHTHPSHTSHPQDSHHQSAIKSTLVIGTPSPTSSACSQQQSHMAARPIKAMKPKLSLNTTVTSHIHTLGKSSSLRLETLSAISPTVRNTFSNGYDPASPQKSNLSRPPLSLNTLVDGAEGLKTPTEPHSSRTPSTSSVSSASTFSEPVVIPYKVSHSLRSILSNSPLPTSRLRRMSISRPIFSAPKRVSFRTPLDEDIKTSIFTLAHSDIPAFDSDSTSSPASDSSSNSNTTLTSSLEYPSREASTCYLTSQAQSHSSVPLTTPPSPRPILSPSSPSRRRSRRPPSLKSFATTSPNTTNPRSPSTPTGSKRDSSSEDEGDDDDDQDGSNKYPETPVAGRRKRRREWAWTLGPLPGAATASTDARDDKLGMGSRTPDAPVDNQISMSGAG